MKKQFIIELCIILAVALVVGYIVYTFSIV